jgi:hypothetical protein
MAEETVSVRLPVSLVDKIRKLATTHERTITGELRVAINAYIRHQERDE